MAPEWVTDLNELVLGAWISAPLYTALGAPNPGRAGTERPLLPVPGIPSILTAAARYPIRSFDAGNIRLDYSTTPFFSIAVNHLEQARGVLLRRGFQKGSQMLYVVTLYSVSVEAAHAFETSVRRGGEWQTLARRFAPELIATDVLLRRPDSPIPLFLCLDFWSSPEAYLRSCRSPLHQALLAARRQLADSAFELGAFTFLRFPESPGPDRFVADQA